MLYPSGREIRDTPLEELGEKRRKPKRNPSGRRIRGDDWLSPLTLNEPTLSHEPQINTGGVGTSDGFLLNRWHQNNVIQIRWPTDHP